MVYDKILNGRFITMRSINEDDAEFSYDIRSRDGIRETVGQVAPNVELQKEYIRKQMSTPGDYYFVIINRFGEKIGLMGIYDIHDEVGEIGRLVSVGEPVETYEAHLLLMDFIREVLKLKRICYVVYEDNKKHISDLKKIGGNFVKKINRSGREALYYEDEVQESSEFEIKIQRIIDKLAQKYL